MLCTTFICAVPELLCGSLEKPPESVRELYRREDRAKLCTQWISYKVSFLQSFTPFIINLAFVNNP